MAKVSSETDKMIDGLMKYSLRPYAQANNISVDEFVKVVEITFDVELNVSGDVAVILRAELMAA